MREEGEGLHTRFYTANIQNILAYVQKQKKQATQFSFQIKQHVFQMVHYGVSCVQSITSFSSLTIHEMDIASSQTSVQYRSK